MSLLTRCPACQTLFKLVPDQLRISEGWVRCGRCDEIFDASVHLSQEMSDEFAVAQDVDPDTRLQQGPGVPALEDGEAASAVPGPVTHEDEVADQSSYDAAGSGLERRVEAESLLSAHAPAAWADVSFIRQARNDAFWHKPLTRIMLVLLCCLLLLGLVGQILFQERNRLAVIGPELRPWLLAFCGAFDCSLSPLQQKASIVIDSATFNKIGTDAYRLTFTVKNTAAIALAVPSIELTLTDTRDKPLLRRVFRPSELGATSDALDGGSEWPVTLGMLVEAKRLTEPVAGYRLLAFYL